MYTVVATVQSIKGHCTFHEVGDRIVYKGRSLEGSFCPCAMMALMPTLYAMRYGARFPWFDGDDTTTFACPDPDNPVVFELRRIEEK